MIRSGGKASSAAKHAAIGAAAVVCLSCTGVASSTGHSTSATACAPRVVDGALPSWAQAGFSPPTVAAHYELGQSDGIVAILFKYPLMSPPSAQARNKILWISRLPADGSSLIIDAQRMAGQERIGAPVRRQVEGGPGPSIVNLPAAGCWRLSLNWSGRTDSLDIAYLRDDHG
jgi:hypothetical protein